LHLKKLDISVFTASSFISSTLSIDSSTSLSDNISKIFLSCSIAITFFTFLANSKVKVPIPEPISKTVSFFDKSAKLIIFLI